MTNIASQPNHSRHNLDRLHELDGTQVSLEMTIETHGIHTAAVGTLEEVRFGGVSGAMVAWTVTTEDGTKIQFADFAVQYVMNNHPCIIIVVR